MRKGIIFSIIMFLLAVPVMASADTTIDIINDSAVPGVEMKCKISTDGNINGMTYRWTVGSEIVSESDSYMPTEEDLGKFITASVYDIDGLRLSSEKMYCSKLPVIYITTSGGKEVISKEEYITARMTMQGNAKYTSANSDLYSGELQIRGRGNSSWYEFTKKPYKIKLAKSSDLLGMGKSKHWVLIANEMDESLMRNMVTYDVSRELGLVTMDGTWVELIMNGSYAGNYVLSEHVRVDEDRVDIYNWEDLADTLSDAIYQKNSDFLSDLDYEEINYMLNTDLSWITTGTFYYGDMSIKVSDYVKVPESTNGGVLMEYNRLMDEVSQFQTDSGAKITVSYPEYLATNDKMFAYTKQYVNRVESLLSNQNNWYGNYYTVYDNKEVGYLDLIDFDSFVGTWVLQQIFCNGDLGSKSTYMFLDVDGKLHMGPTWDWDWASGVPSPWGDIGYEGISMISRMYLGLMRDPYFLTKAREAYLQLRPTLLEDIIKDGGTIDTYHDYIKESALKNEELWKYNLGFEGNVAGFKEWLVKRFEYLDPVFATDENLYKQLGAGGGWMKGPMDGVVLKVTSEAIADAYDADYCIDADSTSLSLAITVADSNAKTAEVVVNGRKAGTVELMGGKGSMDIGTYMFNEEIQTLNNITVRAVGTDFIGYNYLTVKLLDKSVLKGNGTYQSPYEISSAEDLEIMARKVNHGFEGYDKAYYKVTDDFYVLNFDVIGTKEYPFKGHFDGDGHVIRGITVSTDKEYAGMFGYVGKKGVIKNVILKDVKITGRGVHGKCVGGIAGFSKGYVGGCSVSGNIEAFDEAGAIVGKNSGGIVENCIDLCVVNTYMHGETGAVGVTTKDGSVTACGNGENSIFWDVSGEEPVRTDVDADLVSGGVNVTHGGRDIDVLYLTYTDGSMVDADNSSFASGTLYKLMLTSGDNYGFISFMAE